MKGFFIGISMGTALGAYFTCEYLTTSQHPYFTKSSKDLNDDSVPDFVITLNNGHKVPMFGVYNGAYLEYYSASYMQDTFRDNFKDYRTIEDRINIHPLVYWWEGKR